MLAAVALRIDLGEFCGVKEFFETVSELRLEGGKFQRPLAAGTQDRNQTLVDQAVEYVVFIEILKGTPISRRRGMMPKALEAWRVVQTP